MTTLCILFDCVLHLRYDSGQGCQSWTQIASDWPQPNGTNLGRFKILFSEHFGLAGQKVLKLILKFDPTLDIPDMIIANRRYI